MCRWNYYLTLPGSESVEVNVGGPRGNNIYFYLCFSGFHTFLDVKSWFFNGLNLKIRQLSDDNGQCLLTKVESSCKTPHLDMEAK